MDLQGRVAVITGASRGIGRAIALALGAAGADCVLAARSREPLEEVAETVKSMGRRALAVPTDLRDGASIAELAQRAVAEFEHVDVLVNNSGIGGPTGPLWEIAPEEWQETLDVNLTGMFLTCRAFLPGMIERGHGSVINIGSVAGKRPLLHRSPYAVSKLGVVGLTRTLATDAGPHGVRVNGISPGAVVGERFESALAAKAKAQGIDTAAVREQYEGAAPLRRLIDPKEIADAVVFLASERAAAITGEDLNVTAGIVMY